MNNRKQSLDRKQLEIEERRSRVAVLFRAGMSYREIAAGLKLSRSTVGRDILELRKGWAQRRLLADQEFDLDLARLEELLRGVYSDARAGSLPHIQTVLSILDRKARMLAYNLPGPPVQFEGRLDVHDHPEAQDLTDEQLMQIARQALPEVLADPDGFSEN